MQQMKRGLQIIPWLCLSIGIHAAGLWTYHSEFRASTAARPAVANSLFIALQVDPVSKPTQRLNSAEQKVVASPARPRPFKTEQPLANGKQHSSRPQTPTQIPRSTKATLLGSANQQLLTQQLRTAPPPTHIVTQTIPPTLPGETDKLAHKELLSQLHQAINANKRYPNVARRMRQQGSAEIAFRLAPNGAINAITLTRSSGKRGLDRAALTAVQKINPFDAAQQFLKVAQDFRISVNFELH